MRDKIYATAYPVTCTKEGCNRKIVVSVANRGVSHVSSVIATCAECLKEEGISEKWRAKRPEKAKEIEEFISNPQK